jgi:hypothetical protein
MLAIWHLRPAKQRQFPLQKREPRDFLGSQARFDRSGEQANFRTVGFETLFV